jgi:hypothetical protein
LEQPASPPPHQHTAWGKRVGLICTAYMHTASMKAKAALCQDTCRSHPDPQPSIRSDCRCIKVTLGRLSFSRQRGSTRSLWHSFFSKKLEPAQTKYSAFDRKLLAAYMAVSHFCFLLEGLQLICTDSKPRIVLESWPRQQRQLLLLAEFALDIKHIPGQQNVVAKHRLMAFKSLGTVKVPGSRDQLSSFPEAIMAAMSASGSCMPPLDYCKLATSQQSCEEVQALLTSSSLNIVSFRMQGKNLLRDVSTGVVRPVVPRDCRHSFFLALHNISRARIPASK